MRAYLNTLLRATAIALLVAHAIPALAQQVFNGDPIDGSSGKAYPMMPGVALVLPGPDDDFGTGDDIVNPALVGDVDLAVRVGSITQPAVPPPAGAAGGPALTTVVAGGGITGQGAETPFSVLVSDGSGAQQYGNVITAADLNARPVSVYAFADLDGDGLIGTTDADGSADNEFEAQEASSYVGRQVGQLNAGRLLGSLGVHVAAPASMGGLTVVLSAAAYTGTDPGQLFADGPAIYTLWPYFPPLDPDRIIGGGNVPPPDPDMPSELKFDIERNYIPPTGHPVLGGAFTIPVDGSEASTDQVRVISGPAARAAFFEEADPLAFRRISRPRLRPAPGSGGTGRTLVLGVNSTSIAADGGATQKTLRLLPVDRLGNVADPNAGGMAVELVATAGVRITSPDTDQNPLSESVLLADAAGVEITIDDGGQSGRIDILQGSRILGAVEVSIGTDGDTDADGVLDDGNASGLAGDRPCRSGSGVGCDDNCPDTLNASQFDEDLNGLGNCCDGVCVVKPNESGCGECQEISVDPPALFDRMKIKAKVRSNRPDKLIARGLFRLADGAQIDPTTEALSLAIIQNDVLSYGAVLVGRLVLADPVKERYLYNDPTGAIEGVRRVVLKRKTSGAFSLVWRAKADFLLTLAPGAAAATIAIGDDGFVTDVDCAIAGAAFDCR